MLPPESAGPSVPERRMQSHALDPGGWGGGGYGLSPPTLQNWSIACRASGPATWLSWLKNSIHRQVQDSGLWSCVYGKRF